MTELESLRAEVARLTALNGDLLDRNEVLRGQANQSEKLRGQLEALRGSDELVTIKALAADVERLTAERDALRVDAERYRWLREQPNNTEAPRIDVVYWTVADESCNDGSGLRMTELDAAIDAARAAKGTK